MKKIIAALLILATVFVFTACKNKTVNGTDKTETAQTTGKPGDIILDKDGNIVTTAEYYLETDKNKEPLTKIVTDKEGNTNIETVTRVAYAPATYPAAPGETIAPAPTVPAGNTVKSNHEAWPSYDFMSKLPKAVSTVDRVDYSDTKLGKVAAIWINEMSYSDFLKYVDSCKAAGFSKNSAANPPAEPADGKYYAFVSNANGLYLTVLYSTKGYANRYCDVMITVADYDVANSMSEMSTAGK